MWNCAMGRDTGKRVQPAQQGMGVTPKKPAETGRLAKTLRTFDIVIAIIAIFVVGNLLFGGVMLLLGWRDEQQEVFRQTASIALVNIALCMGVIVWEGLANRFWRGKLRQEGWDGEYRVLKCSSGYYILPICGVLLLGMTALLFSQATPEELQTAWERGNLTFPLLFVFGYNIIAVAVFLYYPRSGGKGRRPV